MSDEIVAPVDEPEVEAPPEEVTPAEPAITPEPETQVAPEEEPAAPPTSGDSIGGEVEIEPPDSLMQMLGGTPEPSQRQFPQQAEPQQGGVPQQAPPDNLPPAPNSDVWMTDPALAAQMMERRTEAMVALRVAALADQTAQNSEQIRSDQMRRRAEAFAAVETEKQRAQSSIRGHFKNVFSKDPHYRGNPRVKEFVDQSMQLMTQRAIAAGQAGDPRGFMQINNAVAAKGLLALAYAAHDIPLGSSPATVRIAGAEPVQGKRQSTARPKIDDDVRDYLTQMGISEDEYIEALVAEQGGA